MQKKLRRSKDAWLAGVLGGLAEHFGQDPLLWRLAFVIFLVLTGFMPGVLMYLIAWIMMPPPESGVQDVEYRVVEE